MTETKVDTGMARLLADAIGHERRRAIRRREDAHLALRALADEVERLREVLREQVTLNTKLVGRQVEKWEPLLAVAKEEGNKHNYPCRCKLCLRVAACEEKS